LSKAQREALVHKRAGGSAYAWARMGTLEALHARGLVSRTTGPGAFFSPRTAIQWPLTEDGEAARAYLIEEMNDAQG
jgi:hypothetical protein